MDKVEVIEPIIPIEFQCKRHKQRLLIDALLKCSQLNLEGIALIIDVSAMSLEKVYNGHHYLKNNQVIRLAQLFFICFTN